MDGGGGLCLVLGLYYLLIMNDPFEIYRASGDEEPRRGIERLIVI